MVAAEFAGASRGKGKKNGGDMRRRKVFFHVTHNARSSRQGATVKREREQSEDQGQRRKMFLKSRI